MDQVESPLLSVIIPVHNAERYMEQCIASVMEQGIRDMEILCVDDGSTDRSAEILAKLAKQVPQLRVIRQENRSAGAARNHGLIYAKGKFVHFLDADDWLCPDIYSTSISHLQKTGADVCMFQYISYDNASGQTRKRPCLLNPGTQVTAFRDKPAFFIYNMVAPWNKMYRRDWLERHKLRFDEIVCGNDRGFYFRTLAADGRIVLSGNYGVFYRKNNSKSLTGSTRYRHFDSLFYAWDTSSAALSAQEPSVQAMLLDCVIKDLLHVFSQTPAEHRQEAMQVLRTRFETADFSLAAALPVPCVWQKDVEQIRAGTHPCTFSKKPGDLPRQLASALGIWGIRGFLIKLLTR